MSDNEQSLCVEGSHTHIFPLKLFFFLVNVVVVVDSLPDIFDNWFSYCLAALSLMFWIFIPQIAIVGAAVVALINDNQRDKTVDKGDE